MHTDDYILLIERHAHHQRDDWGVESESYSAYDVALEGLQAGATLHPTEYRGEHLARRRDPQTWLECLQVEDDRLTFRFHYLENYRGTDITVGPGLPPATAGGSTDRSSASYTVSVVTKEQFTPKEGYIHYK